MEEHEDLFGILRAEPVAFDAVGSQAGVGDDSSLAAEIQVDLIRVGIKPLHLGRIARPSSVEQVDLDCAVEGVMKSSWGSAASAKRGSHEAVACAQHWELMHQPLLPVDANVRQIGLTPAGHQHHSLNLLQWGDVAIVAVHLGIMQGQNACSESECTPKPGSRDGTTVAKEIDPQRAAALNASRRSS